MRSAITLVLGTLLATAVAGLGAQDKPATPAGTKTSPSTPAKPTPQAAKPAGVAPATAPAKGTPQTAAKPSAPAGSASAKGTPKTAKPVTRAAAKRAAKPAAKPPAKPAAKAGGKKPSRAGRPVETAANTEPGSEPKVGRRDPFESYLARQRSQNAAAGNLPPGKAGLQVSTLRLDGIVKAPNGMIAVVTNPQSRTYFLREGDQLYDGRVEKIAMDGISFHEVGKDAFGKPVERQVNKRIYSSAGEQQ